MKINQTFGANTDNVQRKKVDRLTNQPTHFTLLQVDGFPLVSAVSRTLLASQSTHLTKVRYSVLYFTWKMHRIKNIEEQLAKDFKELFYFKSL